MIRKLLLGATALFSAGAAHAEWVEASSAHFVVYSEDNAERVKAYATRLERFDAATRALRRAPKNRRGHASRVTVFVVDSIADVRKLSKLGRVAGFYIPRTKALAVMPRQITGGGDQGLSPQAIMFHEYTHHWMLTNWSDAALPAWFVEGAAEFQATAMMRPDGSVIFGAVPAYRRWSIDTRNVLPADEMLRATPSKLKPDQIGALYSRGWLLTHYLTFDPERRQQLAQYIGAINSNMPLDEAAKIISPGSSLDLALDSYVKRSLLPSLTVTASEIAIDPVTVRTLTPGEAAIMPVRIRSTVGVDKDTAPAVLALARQAAITYPNDAAVQNGLAEAEFDVASMDKAVGVAGYARAEAAADRALAADSRSVHALLYKGMARLETAVLAKKADAATWKEVRRPLIAANRIDPEDPEPLILYYTSFLRAGEAAPQSAQQGLLYAYALAPHDPGVRMMAAAVLLRQNNEKNARVALAPLAYRPDLGKAGERARQVLDALNTGGSAAALALLAQEETSSNKDETS